jgi:hypothetical protein
MLRGLQRSWRDLVRSVHAGKLERVSVLRAVWQVLRLRLSHGAAKDYAQDDSVLGVSGCLLMGFIYR